MAKQILVNEISEIVTGLLCQPSLFGELDSKSKHLAFCRDVAQVIANHCGGEIGSVQGDTPHEPIMISVKPSGDLPSLLGSVWSMYDPDGWDNHEADSHEIELGTPITEHDMEHKRDVLQRILMSEANSELRSMREETEIKFDIKSGEVTQEIILLQDDIDVDDLVNGLSSGKYVTTLGYNDGKCNYITTNDLSNTRVAEILSTSVDAEYDFD